MGRGLLKDRRLRLPLQALRKSLGKTQVEVAASAEMRQADLSRLERRQDIRLSTLKRYIQAMGGTVELVAVFPTGHRIVLDV
jgi:predicted transcriptional regulator